MGFFKFMNSGIECDYSFDNLYEAAFSKKISKSLKIKLQKLPQNEINTLVSKWAKKANWVTKKKIGSDKEVYLSFYP